MDKKENKNWLREVAENGMKCAKENMLRNEGEQRAYETMLEYLDPEKRCQVCGNYYQSWGSPDEIQRMKEKHDKTHIQNPGDESPEVPHVN